MKRLHLIAFCSVLLVIAGCVQQRVVWSPNGTKAVVLGEDGLRIMNPDGRLSAMLLPNVVSAAWFPDSSALALARFTEVRKWNELNSALSTADSAEIREAAHDVFVALKAGTPAEEAKKGTQTRYRFSDNQMAAALLLLRDEKPETFADLPDAVRESFGDVTARLHEVVVADLKGETLSVRPPVARTLRFPWEIRVAPEGKAVAWTFQPGGKEERPSSLILSAADGSSPPITVMDQVAGYFDWTRDGRSLLFIRRIAGASGEDTSLGSLARRTVLNEQGAIALADKAEDLAGVLFDEGSKVRALPDGRIVFSSVELHLPLSIPDMPVRPQLFALDPQRQATITRLTPRSIESAIPDSLGFFEVSPDGTRIAFASSKGAISTFDIASGGVQELQGELEQGLRSVPCWRNAHELSFVGIDKSAPTGGPELLLWDGTKNHLLSRNWPKAARDGLLD